MKKITLIMLILIGASSLEAQQLFVDAELSSTIRSNNFSTNELALDIGFQQRIISLYGRVESSLILSGDLDSGFYYHNFGVGGGVDVHMLELKNQYMLSTVVTYTTSIADRPLNNNALSAGLELRNRKGLHIGAGARYYSFNNIVMEQTVCYLSLGYRFMWK